MAYQGTAQVSPVVSKFADFFIASGHNWGRLAQVMDDGEVCDRSARVTLTVCETYGNPAEVELARMLVNMSENGRWHLTTAVYEEVRRRERFQHQARRM